MVRTTPGTITLLAKWLHCVQATRNTDLVVKSQSVAVQ